jgi:hypothetical protein
MDFSILIGNFIIPIDEFSMIFQRGRLKPRSSFLYRFYLGDYNSQLGILICLEYFFSKSKAINQNINLAFGKGLYIAFMLFVFQRMVYCGVYHMGPKTCRLQLSPGINQWVWQCQWSNLWFHMNPDWRLNLKSLGGMNLHMNLGVVSNLQNRSSWKKTWMWRWRNDQKSPNATVKVIVWIVPPKNFNKKVCVNSRNRNSYICWLKLGWFWRTAHVWV